MDDDHKHSISPGYRSETRHVFAPQMFLFWRRITAKTFQPHVKFLAGGHMKLVWGFAIFFVTIAVITVFIDSVLFTYILLFMLWQLVLAIVIFFYGNVHAS